MKVSKLMMRNLSLQFYLNRFLTLRKREKENPNYIRKILAEYVSNDSIEAVVKNNQLPNEKNDNMIRIETPQWRHSKICLPITTNSITNFQQSIIENPGTNKFKKINK